MRRPSMAYLPRNHQVLCVNAWAIVVAKYSPDSWWVLLLRLGWYGAGGRPVQRIIGDCRVRGLLKVKKLLVTGLNGFVGRHLQALLATESNAPWQLIAPKPHDLLDCTSLDAWLQDECPDAVIHLAGQTFVPEAFRDPQRTLQVNLLGTLNVLQALKHRGFSGTFLYVSSGDVYGQVEEASLPISEELAPRPRNP